MTHERAGFGALVDQNEVAIVAGRGLAGRSAAGEEVEHRIAGVGVHAHDAFEDAERLLSGVARLLLSRGRDDGVPPDVGRRLAARGLLGANQSGGHVGDAVGGREVEGVMRGIFGVPEDVVVLGGPAFGGARAVVVRPDDFVLEAGATRSAVGREDFIEQDLAVMDFARVDVEEE